MRRLRHSLLMQGAQRPWLGRRGTDDVALEGTSDATAILADLAGHAYTRQTAPNQIHTMTRQTSGGSIAPSEGATQPGPLRLTSAIRCRQRHHIRSGHWLRPGR